MRNRAFALAVLLALGGDACAASGRAADTRAIGFVFVGGRDDLGYNQATWEGADAVARAFPDNRVLRMEHVPETTAATSAMESLIRDGARILFATSFGYLRFAYDVARRHPDVIVLHQGGVEPVPRLPNFGTYWGTVYEPEYQAGIAAGSATRTKKLGFVAAFPIPATYANVDAFTLGARSVDPAIRTHVVFTKNWCDPAAQASAAERLLESGVDVLTQHQDCTTTILRAAERVGVASVGYHEDGSEVAPKGWLVGAVWNWSPVFLDIVQAIVEGGFRRSPYNGDWRGGYGTGNNPFVLTEFGPKVGERARARIAEAARRFAGGHTPFDGPLRDREGRLRVPAGVTPTVAEIDAMDYFVPGVVGGV